MIYSDDPQTVQQTLHIHRLIRQRIGHRATNSRLQPLWYRGLSNSQMAAADALHEALGDDILEGAHIGCIMCCIAWACIRGRQRADYVNCSP